jgi:hypothetical protein
MKAIILFLLICGWTSAGLAQVNRLNLRGTLNPLLPIAWGGSDELFWTHDPRKAYVTIYSDPSERAQTCIPFSRAPGTLCMVGFEKIRPTRVQVQIAAEGYVTYTANVPNVSYTRRSATVDLGTISLVPNPLRVVSVVPGVERDSSYRFEVVVRNDLSRPVSITRISIDAGRSGDGCPAAAINLDYRTPAVYVFRSELRFTRHPNNIVAVTGGVIEQTERPTTTIPFQGNFTFGDCYTVRLSVAVAVSQEVAGNSLTAFDVVLPRRFTLAPTSNSPTSLPNGQTLPGTRSPLATEALVRSFSLIRFEGVLLSFDTDVSEPRVLHAFVRLPK